jgi:hypothetical protein
MEKVTAAPVAREPLADLPALEEVRYCEPWQFMAAALGWWTAFGAAMVTLTIKYWEYFGDQLPLLIALLTLCAVPGPLLARWLFAQRSEWWTDTNGLRIRSPQRSRSVDWSEVTAVSVRRTWAQEPRYLLETTEGRIALPYGERDGRGITPDHLLASIHQHVRRSAGPADWKLTPEAESFWAELPEHASEEPRWVNPSPPSHPRRTLALCGVASLLAGGGWAWLMLLPNSGSPGLALLTAAFWSGGIAVGGVLMARDNARTALGSALTRSGIEVETIQDLACVPWQDVQRAVWTHHQGEAYCNSARAISRPHLQVSGRGGRELLFPVSQEDPESARFVAELVRRLRLHSDVSAVPLPPVFSRALTAAEIPPLKGKGGGAAEC